MGRPTPPLIDLHSHILPALDDGAPNLEASLGMAVTAVDAGIDTIAATPHVNERYSVSPEAIAQAVGSLNVALARMELPLAVLPGSEIAFDRIPGLDDGVLRRLTLAGGTCLLVEPPYSATVPFLEDQLFDLQVRGFRPMLAHPERARAFRERPERLAGLVERGVLTCVNAGSMARQFGDSAHAAVLRFFEEGLVHVVASDSHNDRNRPPALQVGFDALEEELPGLSDHVAYFTQTAPAAILAADPVPPPPRVARRQRSRLGIFGRARRN